MTALSWNDMVEQIGVAIGDIQKPEDIDISIVQKIMENYTSIPSDWEKFCHADTSRSYTRNGVENYGGTANLLILVWSPGRSSYIHDHANAHCLMKVLKGSLKEVRYAWPDKEVKDPKPLTSTLITPVDLNQVAYISDTIGLHKIINEDPDQIAVSLHLYTPPWAEKFGCHAFNEKTSATHHIKMDRLFSDRGVLLNHP